MLFSSEISVGCGGRAFVLLCENNNSRKDSINIISYL